MNKQLEQDLLNREKQLLQERLNRTNQIINESLYRQEKYRLEMANQNIKNMIDYKQRGGGA